MWYYNGKGVGLYWPDDVYIGNGVSELSVSCRHY